VQPSQTPYHYCFNNPTSFTDPTGLYPEKEKGDKVQRNEVITFFNESFVGYDFSYQRRIERYTLMFLEMNPIGVYEIWGFKGGKDGKKVLGKYTHICSLGITTFSEYNDGDGGSSSGREGANESENGVYAGSMTLNKPKNAGVDAIYEACKPAYERLAELQNENPDKEVGFFLVWNTKLKEFRADFYIGKDIDDWLTLYANKPPDGFLNIIGDVGMGFTHSHPNGPMNFGPDDLQAISMYSLGELKWAGVPNQNVNQNPGYLDSMFFGLMVNGQIVDAFSWVGVTQKGLPALYNNIRALSDPIYWERFISNNLYFGGEQWKKRK